MFIHVWETRHHLYVIRLHSHHQKIIPNIYAGTCFQYKLLVKILFFLLSEIHTKGEDFFECQENKNEMLDFPVCIKSTHKRLSGTHSG